LTCRICSHSSVHPIGPSNSIQRFLLLASVPIRHIGAILFPIASPLLACFTTTTCVGRTHCQPVWRESMQVPHDVRSRRNRCQCDSVHLSEWRQHCVHGYIASRVCSKSYVIRPRVVANDDFLWRQRSPCDSLVRGVLRCSILALAFLVFCVTEFT